MITLHLKHKWIFLFQFHAAHYITKYLHTTHMYPRKFSNQDSNILFISLFTALVMYGNIQQMILDTFLTILLSPFSAIMMFVTFVDTFSWTISQMSWVRFDTFQLFSITSLNRQFSHHNHPFQF